jgi:hypothetical protein
MSSWFSLELDLTPPSLEIIAPQYTLKDISTSITITSNEPLLNWQDIYIVDSNNIRHDLTFLYEDDQFSANVTLNDLSYGIATIYCQLKDTVDNQSSLMSKSINIWNGAMVDVSLAVIEGNVDIEISESIRNLSVKQMECDLSSDELKPSLSAIASNVEIEVTS